MCSAGALHSQHALQACIIQQVVMAMGTSEGLHEGGAGQLVDGDSCVTDSPHLQKKYVCVCACIYKFVCMCVCDGCEPPPILLDLVDFILWTFLYIL